jgi:hypothetical protein
MALHKRLRVVQLCIYPIGRPYIISLARQPEGVNGGHSLLTQKMHLAAGPLRDVRASPSSPASPARWLG